MVSNITSGLRGLLTKSYVLSFCRTISFLKLSTAAPVWRDCCAFSICKIGNHATAQPYSSVSLPVFGSCPAIFKNHAHSNCLHGSKLFRGQLCFTSSCILVLCCDNYIDILNINGSSRARQRTGCCVVVSCATECVAV
jgi:hypothetical protein